MNVSFHEIMLLDTLVGSLKPLDQSFSVWRVVIILIEHSLSKQWRPDPRSAASYLGQQCLPTPHKKNARLKWVPYLHSKILIYHQLTILEGWL